MEIKLFSDLYDALRNIISDVKSIAKIPSEERNELRDVLGNTFMMLDTSLNMVIHRLNDILLMKDQNTQIDEISKLGYYGEWYEIERSFRMCGNLRMHLAETQRFGGELIAKYSVKNWGKLLEIMQKIMNTEYDLAEYISADFAKIALEAQSIKDRPDEVPILLTEIEATKNRLIKERRDLIQQEISLYDEKIIF